MLKTLAVTAKKARLTIQAADFRIVSGIAGRYPERQIAEMHSSASTAPIALIGAGCGIRQCRLNSGSLPAQIIHCMFCMRFGLEEDMADTDGLRSAQSVSRPKLAHLEAARGIASIAVIFWHFRCAFLPDENYMLPFWKGGIRFTPLMVMSNGAGAVSFFFVLSGFVLALSTFRRPSALALLISTAKRLPRLMLPCAVSILIGYFILAGGVLYYLEAATITHSPWLARFGNANFPSGEFTPTLESAIRQSLLVFILPDNHYYNSNLWTMKDEFYGSMLAFGIAAFGLFRVITGRPIALLGGLIVAAVIAFEINASYGQFAAGTALAFAYSRWSERMRLGAIGSAVALLLALWGFSTVHKVWNSIAAVAMLMLLLGNPRLAQSLSGRLGNLLGKYSFPLYLAHTLVILSVSSACYSLLVNQQAGAAVTYGLTLAVTLVCTVLLSLPFAWIDEHWVAVLNRGAAAVSRAIRQSGGWANPADRERAGS